MRRFRQISGLNFEIISAGKGRVLLSNRSQDWPLHTDFTIDFINKEINFDVFSIGLDDRHPKYDDKFLLGYHYFLKAYIPNGRLEILNDEEKELLARLRAYIPVNIDFGKTLKNLQEKIDFLEGKVRS